MDAQNLVWVAKKVIYLFVELFVAVTISFFLILAMPGNPYMIILQNLLMSGVPLTQAKVMAAGLAGYNPDQGVLGRYFSWASGFFLHGNLGYSVVFAGRVAPLIAVAAPWTVIIVVVSLTFGFVTGFFLGLVAASTGSKKLDAFISGLMSLFSSIPSYVLALVLLIVFAVHLGWFPLGGAYSLGAKPGLNLPFIANASYHLFLPILTFYLMLFPSWMFSTRAIATSLMKEDYILVARARGISGNRMTLSYVGRNAFLPQFTGLMFSYGLLFGNSIFIESIFDVPGLGYLLTTAAGARDYELVIGAFLIIIVAVIIGNFIADVGYGFIDPRVRGK